MKYESTNGKREIEWMITLTFKADWLSERIRSVILRHHLFPFTFTKKLPVLRMIFSTEQLWLPALRWTLWNVITAEFHFITRKPFSRRPVARSPSYDATEQRRKGNRESHSWPDPSWMACLVLSWPDPSLERGMPSCEQTHTTENITFPKPSEIINVTSMLWFVFITS